MGKLIKETEIASLERSTEDYNEATKKAYELCKKDNTVDNWLNFGLKLAEQRLFRESCDAFSIAISLDPFKGIIYRHRGHRFLSCYRFQDGMADLTIASRLIPDNWDTWYHLGLANFLCRDFVTASKAYATCLAMSKTDDEVIAVSDWYWMTCKRLGDDKKANEILEGIHDDMAYGDNLAYYRRLKMYKGQIQPSELLPNDLKSVSTLDLVTEGFGLANYYRIIGNDAKADEILNMVLETGKEDMYMAFGYLASLADKKMFKQY